MNEDILSSKQEWYAEADHQPNLLPIPIRAPFSNHSSGVAIDLNATRQCSDKFTQVGVLVKTYANAMQVEMKKIAEAFGREPFQSDYTLFPPPLEEPEDKYDRALRLKQQPHSMTTDRFFDRNGRRRY